MLGWLHRRRGVPLDQLSLRSFFPDSSEASVANAFDFVEFLVKVGGGRPGCPGHGAGRPTTGAQVQVGEADQGRAASGGS